MISIIVYFAIFIVFIHTITSIHFKKQLHKGTDLAYDQLFRTMPDFALITDHHFKITKANPAAMRFFGHSIIGQSALSLLEEDLQQEMDLILKKRAGKVIRELRIRKGSSRSIVLLRGAAITNQLGQNVGYTFAGTDLTILKATQQQNQQLAIQLKKAKETLDQFAYIASHDLKEPLRNIQSFVTLLKRQLKSTLDHKSDEYFKFISRGVQRMYQLIEAVLEVNQQASGEALFKRLDTEQLVGNVVQKMDLQLKNRNAIITLEHLPDLIGDPLQIELLFKNLIDNGIKFNKKIHPILNISCVEKGDYAEFAIQDNGIGIAPDFRDKVFQPFKRLHSWAEYDGTGIGLSICQKIVVQHDGKIWIESNKNGGTIFYFTLPLAKAAVQRTSLISRHSILQPI